MSRRSIAIALFWGMAACSTSELADGQAQADVAGEAGESADGSGGQCREAADCPPGLPCRLLSCSRGECLYEMAADGWPCSDGNPCTVQDQCREGECAGVELTCPVAGSPCLSGSCDTVTGGCRYRPREGWCDDGDGCTAPDQCWEGACLGVPIDCADSDPCTADGCLPGRGCFHLPMVGLVCDDGQPCTQGDLCGDDGCAGVPLDCDDGNSCTGEQCDPESGLCVHQPLVGPACDDGNPCTTGDQCGEGVCMATGLLDCDDGNGCTADWCDPLVGCSHEALSVPCDDGNPCTEGEQCQEGSCGPGKPRSCADGNSCTVDSCDPGSGDCHHLFVSWPCDDGSLCTTGDLCQQGLCVGIPVDCDDANPCTADGCTAAGGCFQAPIAGLCTDGNPCTLGDHCSGGACQAGPSLVDCNDGNPCTADTCSPATGLCVHQPQPGPCSDGESCTVGDFCDGGVCQAGKEGVCECQDDSHCLLFEDGDQCNGTLYCDLATWPFKCRSKPGSVVSCPTAFNTACSKAVCQPQSGQCKLVAVLDESSCSDGDICTLGDRCLLGVCVGKVEVSCDDGNPCTDDECKAATGCGHLANNLPCDDGSLCTIGDSCSGGNCIGLPVQCSDGNPCTTDYCAALTGKCQFAINSGSCNDKNPCTVQDQCVGGVCQGKPRDCDDGNPCTMDSCNSASGCIYAAVTWPAPCDDASACTADDRCQGSKCGGDLIVCGDGNPCTADSCVAATGCLFVPQSGQCDDGSKCTLGDHCEQGQCVGSPLACDDANPCTENGCHPIAGCWKKNLDQACSDANGCTIGDWCVAGKCLGGGLLECTDGNPCTGDWCDPATGSCLHLPVAGGCDDKTPCTTGDKCVAGLCQGLPAACDDGNPCTVDSCQPESGCVHQLVAGLACDDGDLCTPTAACLEGVCVGSGELDCDDGNGCTLDQCIPATGCLHLALNHGSCDDGNPQTMADQCQGGSCQGLPDQDLDLVPEDGYEFYCQGASVGCLDNCPTVANSDQADWDLDGIGDSCELCGEVAPIDGVTPPDPAVWAAWVTGACPSEASYWGAAEVDGLPCLELSGGRAGDCPSGAVKGNLVLLRDLSVGVTVLELSLSWEALVRPFEYLGGNIGELSLDNGAGTVLLAAIAATMAKDQCSSMATASGETANWRFEFSAASAQAVVWRDDVELPDSPFDLSGFAPPWRLLLRVSGGSFVPGCEAGAILRVFSGEYFCPW